MGMSYVGPWQSRDKNRLPCTILFGRNNGELFVWVRGGWLEDALPLPEDRAEMEAYEIDLDSLDPKDQLYDFDDEMIRELLTDYVADVDTAWCQPDDIRQALWKRTVWRLLTIEPNGIETHSLHSRRARAERFLDAYVRHNWTSDLGRMPDDPLECRAKFERTGARWAITELSIDGTHGELCACQSCGRVEHIDKLDAKSDGFGNFTELLCRACYGPGWAPTAI
jgi:hypothetical protein